MSWEKLISLAGSDETLVEFVNSQKTSSETLVTKVNTLETTNSGLLDDIKKFKQGNTLVKDSLGLEVVNSDTLTEALNKIKTAKGDDKLTAEIDNLKGLLEKANIDKDTLAKDYEGKLSNMALTNSLRDLGIGAMAINPLAEKMILDHLKDGASLDGDNIVYRNTDGSTAYNGTNVLTPKDKLEQMKSSDDWKAFIKGDIKSGGDSRESNNGGSQSSIKDAKNKQERTQAIKEKFNLD
jgi:hypothetical protein